jgi:Tol biopolymer transport system component/uncharacterized membrane protein YbhN (UPF0104 family)
MSELPEDSQLNENARRRRRALYALLSIGFAAGITGYLLREHSLKDVLRIALGMDRRAVICFAVLYFGQVFFRTWRYQVLLANLGERIGNLTMFLTTLIRNLFSYLLPARIGSVSYIWVVNQRLRVPIQSAISSFILAFIFDLIVLPPILLLTLPLVGRTADLPFNTLAVVSAVFLALLIVVLRKLPRILDLAGRLFEGTRLAASKTFGQHIREAARQVEGFRKSGLYFRLIVLSLVVRLCKYGAMYFIFYGMVKPYGYDPGSVSVSRALLGVSAAGFVAASPLRHVSGFASYKGAWALSFVFFRFPGELARETAADAGIFILAWICLLGAGALILILLPLFGKRRQIGYRSSVSPKGGLRFTVKAAGVILAIALVASATMKWEEITKRRRISAADIPIPDEEQARMAIGKEINGRIVFDSNRSGTFGIWSMKSDGSDLRIVADTGAHETFPSPSPDGKWIAYTSSRGLAGRVPTEIWLVRVDGSRARCLAKDGTTPSWSADGKRVFFRRGTYTAMAIDVRGGEPEEILPRMAPAMKGHSIGKPKVSRDGRWAAFTSDRKGRWNVWVANLQNGETRHVSKGCEPKWFPEGEAVIFIGRGASNTAIKKYDLSSGRSSVVHDAGPPRGMEYFPSVSHCGRYVFYSAAPAGPSEHDTANYQIYVKPLDGRGAVRLTFDQYTNRWPGLIPEKR